MLTKRIAIGSLTAAIFALSVAVHADTAVESFANGEKSLAKGDFAGALQAYAAAVRGDQNNANYVQHYAMTRRIVDLRRRLDGEKDPQQWEYMARALRAFYVKERIYPELPKLDGAIHTRLRSAESAAMLAETQLAMDRNAEAVATLSALDAGQRNDMTQLLLGIALARSGKQDEAKQIAATIRLPKDASPHVTYTAARLFAITGDSTKAITLLKTCFEGSLPSVLEGFKSHAQTCPEFTAMTSTAEFANVLKTESKVPESTCSGGSNCAGCPMRGKCPSQAKQ